MSVSATESTATDRQAIVRDVKRVVVKVGSAVIAAGTKLRPKVIDDLAYDLTVLHHQGYEVVMVVSGAVAGGYAALGCAESPGGVVERQASACVGQYKLMTLFAKAFARHRVEVAQLLMMQEDIEDRRRFLSARHTLQMLIAKGIVPIVNENDPLADDERQIGDNDHLAALIANVVTAQMLVILSVADGVRRDGGNGDLIYRVEIGSDVAEHLSSEISVTGVGGMAAKVEAAQLASRWGVPTVIASGSGPGQVARVLKGEAVGTLFVPQVQDISPYSRWIAFRKTSRGALRVHADGVRVIAEQAGGLRPDHVIGVDGAFPMGARVDLNDEHGRTFAVGLVSYDHREIARMQGRTAGDFESVLGYAYVRDIIARDDIVVLHHV